MPANERSQGTGERHERKLSVVLLDGLAAQDEHVLGVEPPLELGDQASLADSRITAEEN
jgi:hypothetical protein